MRQATVRVGVIGVGIMGERHARLYAQLPGTTLVGICDADGARAQSVATQWETRAFATPEQLLAEVDAVSIASPTHTHAAVATLALERGVHLLVEKPLADSLAAARCFAERAGQRPETIVQVGHIERFNPVVRELCRRLIGRQILAMTMQRLSPFTNRCLDSDVLQDLMVHDLDLAHAFFGDELELRGATGGCLLSTRLDYATADFAGPEGVSLTLRASRVAHQKVQAITVVTEDACIDADLLNKMIAISHRIAPAAGCPSAPLHQQRGAIAELTSVPAAEPLRLELEYFLECVRSGAQPITGVEAGVHSLTHAEAIAAAIADQPILGSGQHLADSALLVANV